MDAQRIVAATPSQPVPVQPLPERATSRVRKVGEVRLEILRQGRFDTTLPDARFRQLPGRDKAPVPADLASEVERARHGWAWRFFRGRDVYVEAEVSGALRPERVRHGVRKAFHRGAFVLFVVGDAHRARRVRTVLRAMGLGVDRAQVWTLRLPMGSTGPRRETNT